MTYCSSDTLDQFYDVIRVDLRLDRDSDGYWTIWELHRHETGQMGLCQPNPYDRLTCAEALDVLCAIGAELLPPARPLAPRNTL